MGKRIILCGPSAAGKTFLRERMESRGFTFNVSYTSRPKREGEIDGVNYHFLDKEDFEKKIVDGFFYEHSEYGGHFYGTGVKEWNEVQCFIMEAGGIASIDKEERKGCFIIYLDPPQIMRVMRMKERGWNTEKIQRMMKHDAETFGEFYDYDVVLESWDVLT